MMKTIEHNEKHNNVQMQKPKSCKYNSKRSLVNHAFALQFVGIRTQLDPTGQLFELAEKCLKSSKKKENNKLYPFFSLHNCYIF